MIAFQAEADAYMAEHPDVAIEIITPTRRPARISSLPMWNL